MHPRFMIGLISLLTLGFIVAAAPPAQALLPAVKGDIQLQALRATKGAFGIADAVGQTFRALWRPYPATARSSPPTVRPVRR